MNRRRVTIVVLLHYLAEYTLATCPIFQDQLNYPYVFVIVVMNEHDDFPIGGGRPINGGFGTGGGVVVLSSFALDRQPYFQSTLRHELGHGFGLPHVDVFGYDLAGNGSIMSYKLAHRTRFFDEAAEAGELIPEDLRALALNRRVFAKLDFRATRDVPAGYRMAPHIIWLGPMTIPDHFDYRIEVTSPDGATYGSALGNIVLNEIRPSAGPGVNFFPRSMWQSAHGGPGSWVSVDLSFPLAVRLSRIAVHSEHSGQYHRAEAAEVLVEHSGDFKLMAQKSHLASDDALSFTPVKARTWRLRLQRGPSGSVTLRGLRFFDGRREIFPNLVPYR